MTAVMNGRTFGGSFLVCPDARIDDGQLDLLHRRRASGAWRSCGSCRRSCAARTPATRGCRLLRAKRVVIESGEPLLVEADGEIAFEDARRLEIEVLPGALRVLG